MFSRNAFMLRDGYAPAADVARALSKALTTIHRMVNDERCTGARDGNALYVKLDTLVAYFQKTGNISLAIQTQKLQAKFLAEARARLSGEPVPEEEEEAPEPPPRRAKAPRPQAKVAAKKRAR